MILDLHPDQLNTKIWVSVSDDPWFNAVLALTLSLNTILTLTITIIFNDRPRVMKSWIIGRSFRLHHKIELFLESHRCLATPAKFGWHPSTRSWVTLRTDGHTQRHTNRQTQRSQGWSQYLELRLYSETRR